MKTQRRMRCVIRMIPYHSKSSRTIVETLLEGHMYSFGVSATVSASVWTLTCDGCLKIHAIFNGTDKADSNNPDRYMYLAIPSVYSICVSEVHLGECLI